MMAHALGNPFDLATPAFVLYDLWLIRTIVMLWLCYSMPRDLAEI